MGKWTPTREAPAPLEGNVVAVITGGTILWFVLFLVQLPFYGWFDRQGLLWWLWTCLAGAGLGLIGIRYVRRRDGALRHAAQEENGADAGATGDGAHGRGGAGAGSGTEAGDGSPERGRRPGDGRESS